jgi:hypothetical protein
MNFHQLNLAVIKLAYALLVTLIIYFIYQMGLANAKQDIM